MLAPLNVANCIDVLGSLPEAGEFSQVAGRSLAISLFGVQCRVLSLDDLIAVKEAVGRPKDKSVAIELRAIRDRLRKP